MKDAKDLIPWKVTDISIRLFDDFWSFNGSIHFDGETWRCVLRNCDYAMPGGVTIRSKNSRAGQQTKNAMVILDPKTWQPVEVFKMHERDGLPREASCPHVGFEDMRIFRTDKGGLQGIAAALHLKRDRVQPRAAEGRSTHQPPEQVLLSFDENYDIVHAHPIRGAGFSGSSQKNWVPFDHCAEPRFLYAIEKGTIFGDRGPLHGDEARVTPSVIVPVPVASSVPKALPNAMDAAFAALDALEASLAPTPLAPAPASAPEPAPVHSKRVKKKKSGRKPPTIRGSDVRMVRGGRIKIDTMSSRPSTRPSHARNANDAMRAMGTGRVLVPKYNGLRGGSQLVRVGEDAWLGVAHEMNFVSGKKYYYHTWYVVDSRGRMTCTSEPMKLAPNGIEFAAGMAIDGDRVVVSFGVDDMECKLGVTSLSAVMALLRPIERR